ncbi:MAG: hypothetical protein PHG13_01415 [Candidatus Pacebacteria bacterium]|nr:hypothetical protein [Candidatus Paceibacterota bacterium]MDD5721890.1 hypothetical protein [Candidatus Paceibacterota bacterium]
MEKYIVPVLLLSFFIALPCFGQPTVTVTVPPGTAGGLTDIWAILTKVLNTFFNVVLFLAAIMIIFAGWQYITAAGDPEKAKKALNSLVYALIGVGIALLAKVLIYLVANFLGVSITGF